MKICRKKKLCWAALLGMMICLTGCANASPNPITQASESLPAVETAPQSEQQVGEIVSQEPANTEPTRIVETVDDNFHIDAAVVDYPADGMAGVYAGSPKVFTKEEIEAFVNHCGSSIASVKEWDDGDMMYYNGTCSNGYRFNYMRGLESVNHHPYAHFQYSAEHSAIYGEYPIYFGEDHYYTNPKYTIGWMFTYPKQFSFATEKDAEAAVRDALKVLGLPELTLRRTLYIDHNIMEEAGKLLATDENFAPIVGTEENNGYTLRDDWSEEDDAYIFSFGISVSDIPLSYHFQAGDTANYCGTDIIVLYTKYGISNLSVNTPWSVGVEIKESAPIVPAQAALEIAIEKYSYDLSMKDKRIEEIRLEYQYFQNRDAWLLKPVWSIMISYTIERSFDRYYDFTNVDALTGKEL